MKGFTKLGLVAAAATLPAAAFAMQPISNAEMAQVTGQDGITLKITTPSAGLTLNQAIFDRDGMKGPDLHGMTSGAAGAIVIGNYGTVTGRQSMAINTSGAAITVGVDAGQSANGPVLNVNVALPSAFSIDTGDLAVANVVSSVNTSVGYWETSATTAVILQSTNIALNGATLNIQLGNVAQTLSSTTYNPMILLGGTINGGIAITNTVLHDASQHVVNTGTANTSSVGNIVIDTTTIVDGGFNPNSTSATLSLDVGVGVSSNGLEIALGGGFGNAGAINIYQAGIHLGSSAAASIGDVAITGLDLTGTKITITGH